MLCDYVTSLQVLYRHTHDAQRGTLQLRKHAGIQGFFQDFRQEGANVTIVELRGGMYNCCIFQGFCNVIAHS